MLDLIKRVRDHLLSDSTITAFVEDRIYWQFNPVGNTSDHYPQITLMGTDGSTDTVRDVYDPVLTIHIWVKEDRRSTIANEIAKQVLLSLDVESFLNEEPCIYQIWKASGIDLFEDETQTLHKVLTFNVVMDHYNS
jgi:hypothetical protein